MASLAKDNTEQQPKTAQYKDDFLQKLEQLLVDIQTWAQKGNLSVERKDIEIYEEDLGRYSAPMLIIFNRQSKQIAEIKPIGACILGANARVDISGRYDNAVLLHFNQNGPSIESTASTADGQTIFSQKKYLFTGINTTGWYSIEGRRNKGYFLDQTLFDELLAFVSDDANHE